MKKQNSCTICSYLPSSHNQKSGDKLHFDTIFTNYSHPLQISLCSIHSHEFFKRGQISFLKKYYEYAKYAADHLQKDVFGAMKIISKYKGIKKKGS